MRKFMSGNGEQVLMKVKTMIMIAAICFAIIPMIAFVAMTNITVGNDGKAMFKEELTNMAAAQSSSMNAIISKANSDIDTLKDMPGVRKYARNGEFSDEIAKTIDNDITRYISDNPLINSASLVDKNGKVLAGTNMDKDYPGFADYADYKNKTLYFDGVASEAGAGDLMVIKSELKDANDQTSATLFVTYNVGVENSLLSRFTSAVSFYNKGRIIVIDPNGRWSSGSGVNNSLEQFTSSVTDEIPKLQENTTSNIITFNDSTDTENYGVLVKSSGEDGLVALAYCPSSRADSYASKSVAPVIWMTILFSAIAIVAAIFISRFITKPLSKIEETLVKIRRGDHEARIGTVANNEYGQMSRAFNNVVDEIVVSEDRYKTISDMSDNIIFEWNFKTNDVTFSNNFNKKFSYRPPTDHFADSFLVKAKLHPDDADRYRSDLDQLEKGKNLENNEYRIKNIYGDFIWVLIRTATLNDADGKPLKAVGVMVDIDRAKKSEAKLTEQASFDALTELYNRETVESQIDNEISLSEMRKSEMAVLFIDVDDFKHFNDDYSHATGDQVLKFLAKTIKDTVDGIGFAGRYGGDEFIAMIRNAETNSPAHIAQTLIDKLAAGFDADIGERLSISVSIGIAVIKDDYNTRVEYLIGKADDAMYSVKKSGKSNYAFI